jgi:hypothetical protein
MSQYISAFSRANEPQQVAQELCHKLEPSSPSAVLVFSPHRLDGRSVCEKIHRHFDQIPVIGCTTAGAFTQSEYADDVTVAMALPRARIPRVARVLARFGDNVEDAVMQACNELATQFDKPLRELDPKRHVGILLVDAMTYNEERVNAALGNAAPLLSFVGGSAGDGGEFRCTRVFVDGQESDAGVALMLMEVDVPFTVVKTASFEPTEHELTITRADDKQRTVFEINGEPAVDVYAKLVDKSKADLAFEVFKDWPLGLMIDGKPWVRSVVHPVPGGGLRLACSVREGMTVNLMRAVDLIDDTKAAVGEAIETLGATPCGIIGFNCFYRKIEIDAKDQKQPFLDAFRHHPTAGFHTYGESWLDHMNQTLTALVLG